MTAKKTPLVDPTKSPLRDRNGKYHILRTELARGGQGRVYRVEQRPDVVCKIFDYYETAAAALPKVTAMIAAPPDDPTRAGGHVSIAWPTELVYDSAGRFVGFLMPLVSEAVPIERFFRHASRQKLPFAVGLKEVFRILRNVAAIFKAMHKDGYVVGDVNPRNLLVRKDAMCAIIDCDSMQVPAGNGKQFLCTVFVAEFTAPELLSADVSKHVRTIDSELFSLAVLFFKLMMEEFHPFQGIPTNQTLINNLHIENMRNGIFHYMPNTHCSIAKASPPFDCLGPSIQELFRRAFTKPGNRPTAGDWYDALVVNEERLVYCQNDNQHVYPVDGKCVICAVQARLGKLKRNLKPGPLEYVYPTPPVAPPPAKVTTPIAKPVPPAAVRAPNIIRDVACNGWLSCARFADGSAMFWGGAPLNPTNRAMLDESFALRSRAIEDQARRCEKLLATLGSNTSARPVTFLSHIVLDAGEVPSTQTTTLLKWLQAVELQTLRRSHDHVDCSLWKTIPSFAHLSDIQLSGTGLYGRDAHNTIMFHPFDRTAAAPVPATAPLASPRARLYSALDDVGILIDTQERIQRFGRAETTTHDISAELAQKLAQTIIHLHSREVHGRIINVAVRSDLQAFEWVMDIDGFPRADQHQYHEFVGVRQIALSAFCSLLRKQDGTVRHWRRNDTEHLPIIPPPAQSDIVSIAAGVGHYVALKRDGTVVVWGDNSYGQCAVPTHLKNVVKIACGDYHTLALTRDHTIYAWGDNRRGQCDIPASLRA